MKKFFIVLSALALFSFFSLAFASEYFNKETAPFSEYFKEITKEELDIIPGDNIIEIISVLSLLHYYDISSTPNGKDLMYYSAAPSKAAVFIDGVRINDMTKKYAPALSVSKNFIHKVLVSTRHIPGFTGGVIWIETKDGINTGSINSANLEIGQHKYYNIDLYKTGISGRLNYSFYLNRNYVNPNRNSTKDNLYNFYSKLNTVIDATSDFSFSVLYSNHKTHTPGLLEDKSNRNDLLSFNDGANSERFISAFFYNKDINDNFNLRTELIFSHLNENLYYFNIEEDGTENTLTLKQRARYRTSQNNVFHFKAGFDQSNLNRNVYTAPSRVRTTLTAAHETLLRNYDLEAAQIYKTKFGDNSLELNWGVHYSSLRLRNDENTALAKRYNHFNGLGAFLGADMEIYPGGNIYVNFKMPYRFPSPREIYYKNNPDLKEETARQYTIGWRNDFFGYVYTDLFYSHQTVKNDIFLNYALTDYGYVNLPKTIKKIVGFEFNTIDFHGFKFNGAYSFTRGYSKGLQRHIMNLPKHITDLNVIYKYRPAAASLSLGMRYLSPRYVSYMDKTRFGGYVLWNLKFNKEIKENINAYILCKNLLNKRDFSAGYKVGNNVYGFLNEPFSIKAGVNFGF